MTGLFISGCVLVLWAIRSVSFKFLAILLVLERFKILVLLLCLLSKIGASQIGFLLFMVVATMEVTLALVSLTRLWDLDSLVY